MNQPTAPTLEEFDQLASRAALREGSGMVREVVLWFATTILLISGLWQAGSGSTASAVCLLAVGLTAWALWWRLRLKQPIPGLPDLDEAVRFRWGADQPMQRLLETQTRQPWQLATWGVPLCVALTFAGIAIGWIHEGSMLPALLLFLWLNPYARSSQQQRILAAGWDLVVASNKRDEVQAAIAAARASDGDADAALARIGLRTREVRDWLMASHATD